MSIDNIVRDGQKSLTGISNVHDISSSSTRKLPRLRSNSDLDTDFGSRRPKSSSQCRKTKEENARQSSKHMRREHADANTLSKAGVKSKRKSKHKQHKFETVEMTVQRTRNIILSMLEHRSKLGQITHIPASQPEDNPLSTPSFPILVEQAILPHVNTAFKNSRV